MGAPSCFAMIGPCIAGPYDGEIITMDKDQFHAKDGSLYLWLPILVDGKERTGVWRHEHISDSFAIDLLVGGYKAIDGKRSVA